MRSRQQAPLVIAAIAVHAAGTGAWVLSAALLVATLAAASASGTNAPTPRLKLALHAGAAALGAIASLIIPTTELSPDAAAGPTTAAIAAAALATSTISLLTKTPLESPLSPALLSLVAATASGTGQSNPPYIATTIAYAATLAWTFTRTPPTLIFSSAAAGLPNNASPTLILADRRRVVATAVGVLGGLVLAAALAFGLRPIGKAVARWILQRANLNHASGLSDAVWLQGSTDIEANQEVVLRVYGGGVQLLRAFVQTRYRHGRWSRDTSARNRLVTKAGQADTTSTNHVDLIPARTAYHYVFPLRATPVWLAQGRALVDQLGQWRAPPGSEAKGSGFVMDSTAPEWVEGPQEGDTAVPSDLDSPLTNLARNWTGSATTIEQRMVKLTERLRSDFTYSTRSQRATTLDPVLDFLFHNHSGHCEYFASALVLLARASGIPARLVTGYRAHELNPVGGYIVVREQDAHAWAEAWVDGHWTTYDPTPTSFFDGNVDRTSWLAAVTDWAAASWSARSGEGLATLFRTAAAIVALLSIIWIVVRRRKKIRMASAGAIDEPWPEMKELLKVLADRGHARQPAEPLETLGDRVRSNESRTAELIDAYARHRYGGIGDPAPLKEGLNKATQSLRRSGSS